MELNSRCPGDQALEKMGIWGTITSENCLLKGLKGGCLLLGLGRNPGNHPAPDSVRVTVLLPYGVRDVGGPSVLSTVANVFKGACFTREHSTKFSKALSGKEVDISTRSPSLRGKG